MNRFIKPRASYSETPYSSKPQNNYLSEYYSRSGQEIHNKCMFNVNTSQKQNYENDYRSKGNRQEATPKRKVIHLKSVSKSRKDGNSGSQCKKYNIDNVFTEVADFTEFSNNFEQGSRPSLVIEVDLKKHRRSIQDTLVSSSGINQTANQSQHVNCSQHMNKKATFLIKGKAYCDKCAVPYIAKGFVGSKIQNVKQSHPEDYFSRKQNINSQEKRTNRLEDFIQQLDKIEPNLENIQQKLSSYVFLLTQYSTFELNKFQEAWRGMMNALEEVRNQVYASFRAQNQKCQQTLYQTKQKLKEQNQNLKFMRNDIIQNIGRIVDQKVINDTKFEEVMSNFNIQLQQVNQSVQTVKHSNLQLPKIELNFNKIKQHFSRLISIKSVPQQLFSPSGKKSSYPQLQDQDPYRLSFGREMQKIQSPTFKLI